MGRLEALIDRFRELAGERAERVRAALSGPIDADAQKTLVRELHTLHGEAALLGFTQLARVARKLEELSPHELTPERKGTLLAGLAVVDELRLLPTEDERATARADAFFVELDSSCPDWNHGAR